MIGQPAFIPNKIRESNPRLIAIGLLVFVFLFLLVFFVPINLVFKGEWKLNQKIDVAENVFINYQALGLSSITDQLGWESQVPIGTISVRFYAICILLGVLAGYFLALHLAKSQYIAGTIIDRLIIGLIIFGLIGARLFFVAFRWESYKDEPITVFTELLSGGLAFFGMFISCISYLWLYCKRFKFNFFEFADLLAPAVLLGQVIGRWGNFFNYESYGPETSVYWKMSIPATANYYSDLNAVYFHPTFLYEIIPNFILLVFLLWNYNNLTAKRSGIVFSIYAMGYAVVRFITEYYRLDALSFDLPTFLQIKIGAFDKIESLLIAQVLSLALFSLGLYTYLKRKQIVYIKKSMQEYKIN
jgi:phosphatidylglycerol:prolipoprotein diacylglycerol transferase